MNTHITLPTLCLLGVLAVPAQALQERSDFGSAASEVQRRLEAAQQELIDFRASTEEPQLEMTRELRALEARQAELRTTYDDASRDLRNLTLRATNLQKRVKGLEETNRYLSETLLGEYLREFAGRLHVAEDQLYQGTLDEARARAESGELSEREILEEQTKMVDLSLQRLEEVLGGTRFDGAAVADSGLVNQGTFVLIGPAAVFRSANDGNVLGLIEQRPGSTEASVVPYLDEKLRPVASGLITTGSGVLPFDPTLGDAQKVLETEEETILDEIEKGGFVIWPILGMAALGVLIAVYKWLSLTLIPMPSRRRVEELLEAVGGRDRDAVTQRAVALRGPLGKMLQAGVEHIREPRELIEEVMYERVLTTRFKLQGLLPFIAICAASAPLLGLLGTVTGIIETFKTITIQGTGNVKSLSGGISEALITTKFGLIVAIPSLLLHAMLARKARGMVARMETTAVAFANRVSRSVFARPSATGAPVVAGVPDPELVRAQVNEILADMLGPVAPGSGHEVLAPSRSAARPQVGTEPVHETEEEEDMVSSGKVKR